MTDKVNERFSKLLENDVIKRDYYDCLLGSGDISAFTIINFEQNMNLKLDEMVKFILINSECDYITNTINNLDKEVKENLPKDFYDCMKRNNSIERLVITEINKGSFRGYGELTKMLMYLPECESISI